VGLEAGEALLSPPNSRCGYCWHEQGKRGAKIYYIRAEAALPGYAKYSAIRSVVQVATPVPKKSAFCPDRTIDGHGARQNGPVIGIALLDAPQRLLLQALSRVRAYADHAGRFGSHSEDRSVPRL
jgi:hypothetical protein